jgi:hypothetical protein
MRSQYACSTLFTVLCTLRTKFWYEASRLFRAVRMSHVVVSRPKLRSSG